MIPDWFTAKVRRGEELVGSVGIVLAVNVKDRTAPTDDYDGDSIVTEFLSAAELDDIVGYFEAAGFYCETVLDEGGFLKWLTDRRAGFPREHVMVYNLAQSGTGPARLTTVAGLCRLNGLPLLDSDAYAVAITQHKFHSLCLLAHFGLPVARCWSYSQSGWWPSAPSNGTQLIAKPTYDSASIGVHEDSIFTMGESAESWLRERACSYRQPLTVQEFISGFEIEVPVFDADGPETISAVGIAVDGQRHLGSRILSYEQVFSDRYTFYDFANEKPEAAQEARRLASVAFRCLNLSGVGRIDFRVTDTATPLIMEVNCKPHITQHSGVITALRSIGCCGLDLARFLVGSTADRAHI